MGRTEVQKGFAGEEMGRAEVQKGFAGKDKILTKVVKAALRAEGPHGESEEPIRD